MSQMLPYAEINFNTNVSLEEALETKTLLKLNLIWKLV